MSKPQWCLVARGWLVVAALVLPTQGHAQPPVVQGPPVATAPFAHPELDAAQPATFLWMDQATPDDIDQKLDQGFRPTRISTVSASPLRFAALFVRSEGTFARSSKFKHGLTKAALESANSPTRVTDLAVYEVAGATTYAAVVETNPGVPKKAGALVLDAPTFKDFKDKVALAKGRVVDLEVRVKFVGPGHPPVFSYTFSGVLVQNAGVDARKQCLGSGTREDLDRAIHSIDPCTLVKKEQRYPAWRVVTLAPDDGPGLKGQNTSVAGVAKQDLAHNYFYVIEALNPGEYAWWSPTLTPARVGEPMRNLGRLAWRLGARYADLKPYRDLDGKLRYAGALLDNEFQVPVSGRMTATDTAMKPFQEAMIRVLRHSGHVGGNVAVSKDGRLIYAKAFGFARLGGENEAGCYASGNADCTGMRRPGRQVATETMHFPVGSVSKTVTALAVMRLIQDGTTVADGTKLSLDTRPFHQIFPGSTKVAQLKALKIRHLMGHRSALGVEKEIGIIDARDEKDWLALTADQFKNSNGEPQMPGEAESYRNSNYYLLSRIIQKLHGDDKTAGYHDYVKAKLFDPVGILRITRPTTTGTTGPVAPDPGYYGRPDSPAGDAWGNALSSRFQAEAHLTAEQMVDLRLGVGLWAVAPIDLLRLYAAANGTLAGSTRVVTDKIWRDLVIRVPGDDATKPDGDLTKWTGKFRFGFMNERQSPSCKEKPSATSDGKCALNMELKHGGLLPNAGQGAMRLFPQQSGKTSDGLGLVIAYNSDDLWSDAGMNTGGAAWEELDDFAKAVTAWPTVDFFPSYAGKP